MAYRNIYSAVIFFVALFFAGEIGAQTTVQANRVIAKDSLRIAGRWVRLVSTDSTFSAADHSSLPTTKAVYDFVTASAIDTIYVIDGGSDPDTICIADDLCAVLPPGLSASEVAGQIEDSLDVVRDTMQSLRAAILAIQDSLDNVPDGSGTAGQYALWQDGNSLVGSALSEAIDRLTVAAGRTFRITGMATGSFGAGSAGDIGYDQTVNWYRLHNGTAYFSPLRSATNTGLGTNTHVGVFDGSGLLGGSAGLTYATGLLEVRNPGGNISYLNITDLSTGTGLSNGLLFGYNGGAIIQNREATNMFIGSGGNTGILLTSSNLVAIGNFTPDRRLHVEELSATTNSVVSSWRTSAISSGTVTTGFGVRVIEGEAENASNINRIITEVDAVYTTATNAAETSDLVTKVMNAGTLTERLRVDGDDGVIVTGELRVTDLDNDTPTHIAMADADGDMSKKLPGIGLALAADGTPYTDTTFVATQTDLTAAVAGATWLKPQLESASFSINSGARYFQLGTSGDYQTRFWQFGIAAQGDMAITSVGFTEYVHESAYFDVTNRITIEAENMEISSNNTALGGSFRLYEGFANGTSNVVTRAPASMSVNTVFEYPGNDPAAGKVLTGTGTGTAGLATSWEYARQSFVNDYDAALSLTGVGATPDTLDTDSNTKSNDWLFSPSTNTYTYNGYNGRYYSVSLSAQMEDVSGNGETLTLAVYRNGTVTSAVAQAANPNGTLEPMTMHGQTILLLSIGDTINVKASSTSGAGDDFDIMNFSLIIKEI